MKLIVLDRLIALKDHPTHERVLQDLVMDILRVLSSPDLEVRKKTLNLGELIFFLREFRYFMILKYYSFFSNGIGIIKEYRRNGFGPKERSR